MASESIDQKPVRPDRVHPQPVPPLPSVEGLTEDRASTTYSHYRTGLSNHRTSLSEHRTDLSEFRTDLSQHRTGLSEHRTDLSQHRTELSEHRTNLSDKRTDLSMRRTGMGLQRTRMGADRTLMAEIRTSLSLIGFGFTLYKAFEGLVKAGSLGADNAPRNFGLILILLGMLILVGGIWRHFQFAMELRKRRQELIVDGLIHGESAFPLSIAAIVAVGLLLVGVLATLSIIFNSSFLG